jgi:hypothetical protein
MPGKDGARGSTLAAELRTLFDELVHSRDRLADLPPLTAGDMECAERALHEARWFFITPPKGRKTTLDLPAPTKAALLTAAGDANSELFVLAVAVIASKLAAARGSTSNRVESLDRLIDLLDELSFDDRLPRRSAIDQLRKLRSEIDDRIAALRHEKKKPLKFDPPPEKYADRARKAEKPDAFLKRVYGHHIKRGITQADIRRADPAFYNVLHVWCVRNKKIISQIVPPERTRRHTQR